MSAPKTVVECELRGHTVPCKVCGHIPPDFCGQEAIVAVLDAIYGTEGTDTEETTEEAVSDAPKARRGRKAVA